VSARSLPPVCCLLLLAACTRRDPAHPIEGPSAHADVGPKQQAGAQPGPQRALALALSVEHSQAGIGLHVVNGSAERVELAAPVLVTRAGAPDARTPEPAAQALTLRLDCAHQGCVTLEPGSELLAPAWLGQIEGERCDALFRPQAPGEYELVVRSCRGDAEARARFHWEPQ
jgi:hypothetical protein